MSELNPISLSILLIEDDDIDELSFKRLVKKIENPIIHIESSKSIKDATEKLNANTYDLVIADLILPDAVGIGGIKKLQKFFVTTPFIILSGIEDDKLLDLAGNIGVFEFLVKNELTSSLLRRSIRYTLDRFSAEKKQEELNLQIQRSQKIETLGRIAGGISHDVNNNLAIIMGYLEIISLAKSEQEVLDIADKIRVTVGKTANLTSKLLAFGGKQELNRKVLNVGNTLAESIGIIRRLVRSDIELDCIYPEKTLLAMVDPVQFDQIVMNLILNAQDAIGGRVGKIRVTLERAKEILFEESENFLKLSIHDSGSGIEPSLKEKVLEPFFTTKSSENGTGLGLSVVNGIVKQHGGYLDIDCGLGTGATFSVLLPITQGLVEESSKEGENSRGESLSLYNILYVEDEQKLHELVTTVIEAEGHSVIKAYNGKEGLLKFQENRDHIDIVVTDVVMPKMSGKDMADAIREDSPNLPIIFTSGYSRKEISKEEGRIPDNMEFFPKPFDFDSLLETITRMVNKKK